MDVGWYMLSNDGPDQHQHFRGIGYWSGQDWFHVAKPEMLSKVTRLDKFDGQPVFIHPYLLKNVKSSTILAAELKKKQKPRRGE